MACGVFNANLCTVYMYTMHVVMRIRRSYSTNVQSCLWPPYGIGPAKISSPRLSGRRWDAYHTSTHGVALANLECMFELCCTRLAETTERKNRHFGFIAQLCRAVSSQLRHMPTVGKNLLNIDTSSTCPHNMVNFGPLTAEICWQVWGTPANFKGFRVLAALLRGTVVVGVSQTLRR